MRIETLPRLWQPLDQATTATLFHGLPGAPDPPTDAGSWTAAAPQILAHRLSGLALATLSAAGVTLPPEIVASFRHRQTTSIARSLQLEGRAPGIAAVLERAGIPSLFTKGPGLARLYPEPGLRSFTDLDVVVPTARFKHAIAALGRSGFRVVDPMPPRSYFYTLCREATALSDGKISIDLHHRIPPWSFSHRLTFATMLREAEQLELGNGSVHIPAPHHQFVIALLHVFSHLGRPGEEPIVWRDVVTLAHQVDADKLVFMLGELGLGGLARYVFDELPSAVRPPVADRLPRDMPRGLEFRLRQLMPPNIGARHVIGMLYRLPVSSAPAFVAGYAFPSKEFIRTHVGDVESPTVLRWWRAGIRGIISARREIARDQRARKAAARRDASSRTR